MNHVKTHLLILTLICVLSGCAAVAVGGAATTGAAVLHDRRTTGTFIDDQTIEIKALRILYTNERLRNNTHVNATCYNGVLLLTGEAPTQALRDEVAQKMRYIPKVSKIVNEINLAAPSSLVARSSDIYVASKVKVALFNINGIKDFDPTRVKVVTENGVVYLMGILRQHELNDVIEVSRRVGGVQRVVNLLEIRQ